MERVDAVIIGAGFYGCAIALHLRTQGFAKVLILEREDDLLTRASYANQARVHNGYHYPRNFITAYRSHVNYARFCKDYAFAVQSDFVALYAVAARRSKVTPIQYERFMTSIGATFQRAPSDYRRLFDPSLIAAVYIADESAFNAAALRAHFKQTLPLADVRVDLCSEVDALAPDGEVVRVTTKRGESTRTIQTRFLFNCTYARLNYNVRSLGSLTPLKHETTEIALIDPPVALRGIGVTVVDGPFFSCMPFPAERCHSLSHVRYTPQGHLVERNGNFDPIAELRIASPLTRVHFMLADAARYVPALREARYLRSLFEIKTVLVSNEVDDGRPILFRREPIHPHAYSVLGGKIDNIYDVLDRLSDALN
jgi:glycine/D-amino acid oxidase-like deaminating enzyme